jgi:hypothetical protein
MFTPLLHIPVRVLRSYDAKFQEPNPNNQANSNDQILKFKTGKDCRRRKGTESFINFFIPLRL